MKKLATITAAALLCAAALHAADPAQVQYTVPLDTQTITNAIPANTYGTLAELTLVGLAGQTATITHVKPHRGGQTTRVLGATLGNATTYWPGATNEVLFTRGDALITTLTGTNAAPVQVILRIRRE